MKTLLIILLVFSSVFASAGVVKVEHSELASRVNSSYIKAFTAQGWKYVVTVNSKGQLIYIFTK